MPTVRYHRRAREDVQELWLYIAHEDIVAADRYIDELDERAQTYATHPQLGRAEPDMVERLERTLDSALSPAITVRSFLPRNHRCYYIPDADGIYILRVLDTRRDRDTALNE